LIKFIKNSLKIR